MIISTYTGIETIHFSGKFLHPFPKSFFAPFIPSFCKAGLRFCAILIKVAKKVYRKSEIQKLRRSVREHMLLDVLREEQKWVQKLLFPVIILVYA